MFVFESKAVFEQLPSCEKFQFKCPRCRPSKTIPTEAGLWACLAQRPAALAEEAVLEAPSSSPSLLYVLSLLLPASQSSWEFDYGFCQSFTLWLILISDSYWKSSELISNSLNIMSKGGHWRKKCTTSWAKKNPLFFLEFSQGINLKYLINRWHTYKCRHMHIFVIRFCNVCT